jgi:DNA segregation ATPase FtsK/SpoIIIE, S-DNA-T family
MSRERSSPLDFYLLQVPEAIILVVGPVLIQPMVFLPLLVLGTIIYMLGPIMLGILIALMIIEMIIWRLYWPDSYERRVALPFRTIWFRLWHVQKRWRKIMQMYGLIKRIKPRQKDGKIQIQFPRVREVIIEEWRIRVLVEKLDGQTIRQWQDKCDALKDSFNVFNCRISGDDGNLLWMDLQRTDPLAHEIHAEPLDKDEVVNLLAIPIGRKEDGERMTLKILGNHTLMIGRSGSGKSGTLWMIIHGLATMVRDGLVQIWAIDPKGGMELGIGRGMFTKFADSDPYKTVQMLQEAVGLMRARQKKFKDDRKRKIHSPTLDDPVIVIIIDEILSLMSAMQTDTDMAKDIYKNLWLLLTQGRAVGIVVIAAAQNPRKDLLMIRDEFGRRICFAVNDEQHPDMALGEGARQRGARCDDPLVIPESLPGVGFMQVDNSPTPVKFRSAWLEDDDIIEMEDNFAPTIITTTQIQPVLKGSETGQDYSSTIALTKQLQDEADIIKEMWERMALESVDDEVETLHNDSDQMGETKTWNGTSTE